MCCVASVRGDMRVKGSGRNGGLNPNGRSGRSDRAAGVATRCGAPEMPHRRSGVWQGDSRAAAGRPGGGPGVDNGASRIGRPAAGTHQRS